MDSRRDRPAVGDAYAATRAQLRAAIAGLARDDRRLAAIRLTLAAAAVALGIGGLLTNRWPWALALVPATGLVAAAVVHARRLEALSRARRRLAFVERGLARVEHRWHGLGHTERPTVPPAHVYADDLDVFGHGSLFDRLCTARTDGGAQTLAAWLLSPADPATVAARQIAVQELAEKWAFREDLATLGPDLPATAGTNALGAWAAHDIPAPAGWVRASLIALSLASVSGLAIWGWTGTPPVWLGGALTAQAVVGWRRRPRVLAAIRHVDQRARELSVLAALVTRIEREPCTSAALIALQQRLSGEATPAAAAIARLARLAHLLASRQNQFFGPFALLLFWATHLSHAIDGWRLTHGRRVPDWFAAIGELEALAALATFTAERPDAVFPVLAAGSPRLQATALTHPLLPPATAVGNDVALGGDGPRLLLVSGSNMSGKSTFLRALGVNVVLAQAGAPVTAATMTLTPLTPAGTLRVQDSLEAGASRFFAEITKLRAIVGLARGTGPTGTLFLLDELLAGTNSHDRRLGAERLLHGLVALGAIGLATTHDLALTSLADADTLRAVNVHFADRFEHGRVTFDYRLRPGVVETSNALALMRAVGLDV